MKSRLFPVLLFAALLLILAGCTAPLSPQPAPVSAPRVASSGPAKFADRTVLDERALLGAELAYKSARTAVELATDAGLVTGARAEALILIDARAYGSLLAARRAYAAGNAASFGAALDAALPVIEQVRALAAGK